MYAMTTLTKKETEIVFASFVYNNINIDTSKKKSSIVIFNKKFNDLSVSFRYLVSKIVETNVSTSVLYWVAASLDELQSQSKIKFTARNIHYYVLMLHYIGVKLVEDATISINMYTRALGIDSKEKGITHELYVYDLISSIINPYMLFEQKKIDDKILRIVSSITNVSFEDVKLYEDTKIEECASFYDSVDNYKGYIYQDKKLDNSNSYLNKVPSSIFTDVKIHRCDSSTISEHSFYLDYSDDSSAFDDSTNSDSDDSTNNSNEFTPYEFELRSKLRKIGTNNDNNGNKKSIHIEDSTDKRKNKKTGFGSSLKSIMIDIIFSTKQFIQCLIKPCRS